MLRCLVPLFLAAAAATSATAAFVLEEATIESIHRAFADGALTSRGLVELYLRRIASLDPILHAVVELDAAAALAAADRADAARLHLGSAALPPLHGIPVLIKDNIAAAGDGGALNATAGSLALVGSRPARDAGVVERLRSAGAVILGTASLSEWCNFRAPGVPAGWSPRGGQGLNPYVPTATTCSSSSGSAIAAAANMAAVTIGTETDGSIMCPSSFNSVVGIKPTVGLTSRAGVIIISPRMDTVGPICRTVSDAVNVLEAIVGYDPRDAEATRMASQFIPEGGYRQFLNIDGLRGKRIGILRKDFFLFTPGSVQEKVFGEHFDTMREIRSRGDTIVWDLEKHNTSTRQGDPWPPARGRCSMASLPLLPLGEEQHISEGDSWPPACHRRSMAAAAARRRTAHQRRGFVAAGRGRRSSMLLVLLPSPPPAWQLGRRG